MARKNPNSFAGELLQRGGQGLAGFGASRHLERRPGGARDQSFAAWKTHLGQRVLELGAALRAGAPELFVARVGWAAKAFMARGGDLEDFAQSLAALREVLAERLPEPARGESLEYLDKARATLDHPPGPPTDALQGGLDPARFHDRLALAFLEQVLSGRTDSAIEHLLAEISGGRLSFEAAYVQVLLPAEREIGELWHVAKASVAEEHLVTFAIQRCMVILSSRAPVPPANGRTAVFAAVAHNAHDIGLRAAAELYRMAGWRTIFLGADVPATDLAAMVEHFEADVLLLGATLAQQLTPLTDAIQTIRGHGSRHTAIIVGGAAFDDAPDLWQASGADAYAPDLSSVVALGNSLVKPA